MDPKINYSYKKNKIEKDKYHFKFKKKIKKSLKSQEVIEIIENTLNNDIIILPAPQVVIGYGV